MTKKRQQQTGSKTNYKVDAQLIQYRPMGPSGTQRFFNVGTMGGVSPVNITPGGVSRVLPSGGMVGVLPGPVFRPGMGMGTPVYPGGIPYVPAQGPVRGMVSPPVSPFSSLYQQLYPGLRGFGSYLPVGSVLGGPMGNLRGLFMGF